MKGFILYYLILKDMEDWVPEGKGKIEISAFSPWSFCIPLEFLEFDPTFGITHEGTALFLKPRIKQSFQVFSLENFCYFSIGLVLVGEQWCVCVCARG